VRRQDLAAKQVSSVRELEQVQAIQRRATANLAAARAQLGVAEAEVRVNRINLDKAVIRSPIGGVVLRRSVDPGQTVAVTFQAPVMFTIAENLAQMELQVDVDEADVGRIKVGQLARFSVDAWPDRQFPARIRDIRFGSEVTQGVVTYKAVLTIDNSDLSLRPGMTATAEIVTREVKDAVLVPNTALRFVPPETQKRSWLRTMMPGIPTFRAASKPEEHGPERNVWVLRDGDPVAVPVTVGASDGKRTEIVKGDLAPGAAVIVDVRQR
jgi:HlyD family secretion protein